MVVVTPASIVEELYAVVQECAKLSKSGSYTNCLFDKCLEGLENKLNRFKRRERHWTRRALSRAVFSAGLLKKARSLPAAAEERSCDEII